MHTKDAVLLKGIGQSYNSEQQARVPYLLSVMMGQPAAADKVSGQVIWDIRQRILPVGSQAYYATSPDSVIRYPLEACFTSDREARKQAEPLVV